MVQNTTTNEALIESPTPKPWIRQHPVFTTFAVLILTLIATTWLYFWLRPYFSTFERSIEHSQLTYSMPSPNGEYVAEIYGDPYGGAAGGVTMWVDVRSILNVTDSSDSSDTLDTLDTSIANVKTIYRSTFHGNNHLEWEDENKLRIENRNEYADETVTLNIHDEIYDGQGWACQSLRMKDQYMRCLAPEN